MGTPAFQLGATVSKGLSAAMSTQADQKDPGMFNGLTPADKQKAIDYLNKQAAKEAGYAGATSYGTSFGLTGSKIDKQGKAAKAQAAFTYLTTVQGLTPDEAHAQVNKILSNPSNKFKELTGFKKWVKEGGGAQFGLQVGANGNISPVDKFKGPSYNERNPELRNSLDQANQEALTGINGIIPNLANDVGASVAFRQNLRNQMLGDISQQNTEGITPQQAQALSLSRLAAEKDYTDTFNDNVKNVVSDLGQSGALSSSLLGNNLRRGAFDAYGKFLTGLQASTAGQEQQYLNDASQRTAQRMSNLSGAYASGGSGSLADLANPYANPATMGMATDPEQAALILQKQKLDQYGRLSYAQLMNQANLSQTAMPNSAKSGGGIWGTLGTVAGGIAGAAVGNPMLGAQLGGAVGNMASRR